MSILPYTENNTWKRGDVKDVDNYLDDNDNSFHSWLVKIEEASYTKPNRGNSV